MSQYKPKPENHVTVPDLKKRGWTVGLINKYLGIGDDFLPNPFYKNAAPMQLYHIARIQMVENTPEWKNILEKSAARRKGAEKAVITKKAQLISALEALVIEVPRLEIKPLFVRACRHYNNYKSQGWRDDWESANLKSDNSFLLRISVNYLRHQLTHYERELSHVYGKVGVNEAYIEINRKVYDAISNVYPELQEECQRQLNGKMGIGVEKTIEPQFSGTSEEDRLYLEEEDREMREMYEKSLEAKPLEKTKSAKKKKTGAGKADTATSPP